MLQKVTSYYKRLEGVLRAYRRLQGVTRGNRGFLGFKGVPRNLGGYDRLQGFT